MSAASDDYAAGRAEIEQHDKRLSTPRAELARRGYELHVVAISNGSSAFLIARWGRSRELPDVAAVESFLHQAGAR